MKPYGGQEHCQHQDRDVYGSPDRQYRQFASHVRVLSALKPQGFALHVSRKSIANKIIAIFTATEIVNIVRSLIMLIPFLSVSPS